MTRTAEFHIHDTTLQVSTVVNPPPADPRKLNWGPGFQSPDWETCNRLVAVLKTKGFHVTSDPSIDRNFPILSRFHRLAVAPTPHGDLHAHLECRSNGCDIEFFQEVVVVNSNGGRYDMDRKVKMPYLIRRKFEGTVAALCANLVSRGFVAGRDRSKPPVVERPIAHRLAISEGKGSPTSPSEISAAALDHFNATWNSPFDEARGTSRFKRDETGWPAASEIHFERVIDHDGVPIRHGEVRLFRDPGTGYLARGRVYGGINGRWMVIYGHDRDSYAHLSSSELFNGDPRTLPRRLAKPRKLETVLAEAIRQQNFERAIVLRDLIARRKSTEREAAPQEEPLRRSA